jgi:hypothetical protein
MIFGQMIFGHGLVARDTQADLALAA